MKFYDIKPILSKNCLYNFIWGGRGNGKSYAIKSYLLERFKRSKKQFVLVLRDTLSRRSVCSQYFEDVCEGVTYTGGKFMLEDAVIGYAIPLTLQDKYKSTPYTQVESMVFEEFCCISECDYLEHETNLFMSLVSTVFRYRSGKVFFIGNNISKNNPYFEYFDIDIVRDQIRKGDIKTYKRRGEASVAVEWCTMPYEKKSEIPQLQRVRGNSIATTGDFTTPEDVITSYMITTHKGLLTARVKGSEVIFWDIYIKDDKAVFCNSDHFKNIAIVYITPLRDLTGSFLSYTTTKPIDTSGKTVYFLGDQSKYYYNSLSL